MGKIELFEDNGRKGMERGLDGRGDRKRKREVIKDKREKKRIEVLKNERERKIGVLKE